MVFAIDKPRRSHRMPIKNLRLIELKGIALKEKETTLNSYIHEEKENCLCIHHRTTEHGHKEIEDNRTVERVHEKTVKRGAPELLERVA